MYSLEKYHDLKFIHFKERLEINFKNFQTGYYRQIVIDSAILSNEIIVKISI